MKRYGIFFVKGALAFLLTMILVTHGSEAFAQLFPVQAEAITAENPPPSQTATQWSQDITVTWTAPTFTGDYTLTSFIYVFTTGGEALTFTQFNAGPTSQFTPTEVTTTPYLARLSSQTIASDDFDDLRYLHIKTVYKDTSTTPDTPGLSTDTVVGPFNIDNVVTGTFQVIDPDTQLPLVQTSETTVTLKVTAPQDGVDNGLHINEVDSQLSGATAYPLTKTTYDLQDTSEGLKTLYAWFEDEAGNFSAVPQAASFSLVTEEAAISPETATIQVGYTQTFQVANSADAYTWTVVDERDGDGVLVAPGTVAALTGTYTDTTADVEVVGVGAGTCLLTAQSASTTLTSGTITVFSFNLDVDNNGQETALGDGIMIVRRLFGFSGATLTANAKDTVNCQRCDDADIAAFIDDGKNSSALDVDDDGEVTALGDGIMIVRRLFGFSGATMTANAKDTVNCQRCDDAAIQAYIDSLRAQ